MIFLTRIEHQEWSNRIRRRGIRRVAKEAGVDYGWLSRAVNNKVIVSEKAMDKLRNATNKLEPIRKPIRPLNQDSNIK